MSMLGQIIPKKIRKAATPSLSSSPAPPKLDLQNCYILKTIQEMLKVFRIKIY